MVPIKKPSELRGWLASRKTERSSVFCSESNQDPYTFSYLALKDTLGR